MVVQCSNDWRDSEEIDNLLLLLIRVRGPNKTFTLPYYIPFFDRLTSHFTITVRGEVKIQALLCTQICKQVSSFIYSVNKFLIVDTNLQSIESDLYLWEICFHPVSCHEGYGSFTVGVHWEITLFPFRWSSEWVLKPDKSLERYLEQIFRVYDRTLSSSLTPVFSNSVMDCNFRLLLQCYCRHKI